MPTTLPEATPTNEAAPQQPPHAPKIPPQNVPNWPSQPGNGGGVGAATGPGDSYAIQEINADRLTWTLLEAFPSDVRGHAATSFLAGSNVLVQATSQKDLSGLLLHYVTLGTNGASEEFSYPEPFACAKDGGRYYCEMHISGWDEYTGPLVSVAEPERVSRGAALLYSGSGALVVSGSAGAAINFGDPDRIVKNVGGESCVTLGSGVEKVSVDFLAAASARQLELQGETLRFSLQDFLTAAFQYQAAFQRLKPFSEYHLGVRFSLFEADDSSWWVRQPGAGSYPAGTAPMPDVDLCDQDGKAVFPAVLTAEPINAGLLSMVYDNARSIYLAPSARAEVVMHAYGHSLCQLDDEYLSAPLNRWSPNCARNEAAHLDFPLGLGGFGPPFYPGCRDMDHSRSSAAGLMHSPVESPEHNSLGAMLCRGVLEYYGAEKRS